MIEPVIPLNENKRLEALHSYGILNTTQHEDFDQITDIARSITGLPVSLISFVDEKEVWFKSANGLNICSSDKNLSFCSFAVSNEQPVFIIKNTKADDRFIDHPYANVSEKPIIFYAGVCLIDSNGYRLGTLCVIDHKANNLNQKQLNSLQILAKQVIKLIELHAANEKLLESQKLLELKNKELKNFAGIVSHDMKMPLANIILTTDILKAKYGKLLDVTALEYLQYLKQSSFTLSEYITGLLEHYESDKHSNEISEIFDIHHLLEEIVDLLNINLDCEIHFPDKNIDIICNRAALEQIFLNLIGNSIKYNDKDRIVINIECSKKEDYYLFTITDNGVGIPKEKLDSVFDLFTTLDNVDRNGQKGNGIGLSTVKKIVNSLGGTIHVKSELGTGTTFEFSVKKIH